MKLVLDAIENISLYKTGRIYEELKENEFPQFLPHLISKKKLDKNPIKINKNGNFPRIILRMKVIFKGELRKKWNPP